MQGLNVMKVARWEFVKNIKSPTFLILTFIFPLVMLVAGAVGAFAEISSSMQAQKVAVIDETGGVFPLLQSKLDSTSVEAALFDTDKKEALFAAVEANEYNGLLVLAAEGVKRGEVNYYVRDNRDQNTAALFGAVREAVTVYRLEKMGLGCDEISLVMTPVSFKTLSLAGEEASIAGFLIPFGVAMLLIFAALFSGQVLMYGVIREKRNRIVEILLSSVSAFELLSGKLIGYAALGLLQVTIWLAVGFCLVGAFYDLRQLSISAADIIPSALFFLGGYLLFASLFAALGATMKDAEGGSQIQGLVVIVPMVPIFASGAILLTPNALWAKIMTFIPIFTPATVLMRMAATTLPWWELALAFMILVATVLAFICLGARIFSRGLLQYERTLSFKEIRRMLKTDYR